MEDARNESHTVGVDGDDNGVFRGRGQRGVEPGVLDIK